MKEYIDKQELQQTMNRCENEWEQIPSWFNAQGIIELQPTITEAEIRNKAIDDFMENVALVAEMDWEKCKRKVWQFQLDNIARMMKEGEI